MKRALLGVAWFIAFMLAGPARGQEAPRLDVVFLLDATGSMGDEIDAVKEKIREMISQIAVGDPAPDVRFGIVAYRDREDEYVTVVYELTRDIDRIIENLGRIEASGGGDYPESLTEALHTAVHQVNWEPGEGISRLVFLIADAPPHLDYPDDFDYVEEYQMAMEQGITVHAMGASGLDEEGERIFREIAAGTGGEFQWLAYESRYMDQDGDEVVVVVEGRTATYSKGDSTWTVEGSGFAGMPVPEGAKGGDRSLGGGMDMAFDADAAAGVPAAVAEASGVETSTNLADLITSAVREAAEEQGVDYDEETSVKSASWGEVKEMVK